MKNAVLLKGLLILGLFAVPGLARSDPYRWSRYGELNPSGNWTLVAGNFRGDLRSEVAAFDSNTGEVWVSREEIPKGLDAYNAPRLRFTRWATLGPGWTIIAGNFAGEVDSYAEIVAFHQSTASLWLGKNTGSAFSFIYYGSLSPRFVWALLPGYFALDTWYEDVLKNGLEDVVAYNSSDGSLWVGANTGYNFSFTQYATLWPPPAGSSPVGTSGRA